MPETITNDSLQLANVQIDRLLTLGEATPVDLAEQAAPATPSASKVRLYAKSDGRLYLKDDAGQEVALDASTAGAVMKSLYDAYSILAADTDNTPQAITLSAGQALGRPRGGGGIAALGAADLLDVLSEVWSYRLLPDTWYDGTPLVGGADAVSGQVLTANRLYAIPFWCPRQTTWAKIGVKVTTADAGKKIKLGVCDVKSNGEPNNRLLTTSEMSLDSSTDLEAAISLSLDAGLHCLMIRSDSSTAQLKGQSRVVIGLVLGCAGLGDDPGTYWYSDSGSYAADGIPSVFPSSPSRGTETSIWRPMLKTGATP